MVGQRRLETTAKRGSVDRRHHELLARLDFVEQVREERLGHGLAELRDVGAGNERAPLAQDQDGF